MLWTPLSLRRNKLGISWLVLAQDDLLRANTNRAATPITSTLFRAAALLPLFTFSS
jgi:hypothetical protein